MVPEYFRFRLSEQWTYPEIHRARHHRNGYWQHTAVDGHDEAREHPPLLGQFTRLNL